MWELYGSYDAVILNEWEQIQRKKEKEKKKNGNKFYEVPTEESYSLWLKLRGHEKCRTLIQKVTYFFYRKNTKSNLISQIQILEFW